MEIRHAEGPGGGEATVIGIDCATEAKKNGIACGIGPVQRPRLEWACLGVSDSDLIQRVASWICAAPGPVVIALDAPLGWPVRMIELLGRHEAGRSVGGDRNDLFLRETDRSIRQLTNKKPLMVGADRIALTAHAALHRLDVLRGRTKRNIPLAWQLKDLAGGPSAIEVYPSATLRAYGQPFQGYKKNSAEHRAKRKEIRDGLANAIDFGSWGEAAVANADVLDACVCVLAGFDFLKGEAVSPSEADPPVNIDLARREGWIWVRKPK